MKQFFIILCFISLIFFVCTHAGLVIQGTTEGLSVWYNNLVPVVLPFLLISGYFISSLNLEDLTNSQSILIILITGLFCGYPIGAIVISRLYQTNMINARTAYTLMPLCNNISPMFLIGYIYQQYMQAYMPLYTMLGLIYGPQILYAGGYLLCTRFSHAHSETDVTKKRTHDATKSNSTSVMENSISTITIIGLYVVIFSILSTIIMHYNRTGEISIQIAASFLEITKGITDISLLNIDTQIKTALILSLTSFGGISSIFQSVHILKESKLSLSAYILGKLICGTMTYVVLCII